MKRSQINAIMAEADAFVRAFGFVLSPFACRTPQEFRSRAGHGRVIAARMGWGITDDGKGKFGEPGLSLFTLCNGRLDDLQAGGGMASMPRSC